MVQVHPKAKSHKQGQNRLRKSPHRFTLNHQSLLIPPHHPIQY